MNNGIKAKGNSDKFFTIEFFGVTVILTSFLLLVCLLFGESVLFEIGVEVQAFILGVFGYFSYPFLVVGIYVGFMMLLGRKSQTNRSKKPVINTFIFVTILLCLLTALSNLKTPLTLEEYLANAFESGRNGLEGVVAGGALFSLLTYPFVKNLTHVGSIICLGLILLIFIVFISRKKPKENVDAPAVQPQVQQPQVQPQPQNPQGYQGGYNGGYYQNPNYNQGYTQPYNQPYQQPNMAPQYQYPNQGYERSELFGDRNVEYSEPRYQDKEMHDRNMQILYGQNAGTYSDAYNSGFSNAGERQGVYNEEARSKLFDANLSSPIKKEEVVKDYVLDDSFSFDYKPEDLNEKSEVYANSYDESNDEAFDVDDSDSINMESNVNSFMQSVAEPEVDDSEVEQELYSEDFVEETKEEFAKKLIENMPLNYKYKKPPISIFKTIDATQNNYEFEVFKAEMKARILTTLKTFGVDTDIPRVFKGPAVTRFDIAIPPNIPMSKVTKLQNDLNLRIAAKSAIRMIAPVPNTSYVGIEVPNKEAESVSIKDILVSDEFINTKPFSLVFALGKDVIGRPVSLDIADMPHLLVTGTTGSGKSVCLNALIISLITKYGPDELRFVIVDPKRVDLEPFKGIPHMMFEEIIEDVPTANSMLTWAVEEMESRYRELAKTHAKNIKDYNNKARASNQRIMPRIVILMDEFSDIMMQDKKGVATKVCLIAQKARAAGIHLVLAAQRPSVDIIDGPIKSNLPSRIVFRAASLPDSMTSLGEGGAEKLLGKGDCLYKTNGMLNVERVMGAYVSDEEMYEVIDYVTDNNDKYFDHNNWAKIKSRVTPTSSSDDSSEVGGVSAGGEGGGAIDPIYIKALRLGYNFGGLSVSFLQRKLAIGFPRAGKIIDWLTDNGYITADSISGKRQMIMTKEDFEEKFGAE